MTYSDHFKTMVNKLIDMLECEYLGMGEFERPYKKKVKYKSEYYRQMVEGRDGFQE